VAVRPGQDNAWHGRGDHHPLPGERTARSRVADLTLPSPRPLAVRDARVRIEAQFVLRTAACEDQFQFLTTEASREQLFGSAPYSAPTIDRAEYSDPTQRWRSLHRWSHPIPGREQPVRDGYESMGNPPGPGVSDHQQGQTTRRSAERREDEDTIPRSTGSTASTTAGESSDGKPQDESKVQQMLAGRREQPAGFVASEPDYRST